MMRTLYRWLLWLHPPVFRREFAGEMLWIFDEAAESEGPLSLFGDGLLSLARQWLLRSGAWKVAAAVVAALAQITAGGLGMLLFGHAQIAAHLTAAQFTGTWRGSWRSAVRSGPLEVAIGKNGAGWFGEIRMEGLTHVPARDIAVRGSSLRFRAGDTLFRGKLIQDARQAKLAGTFAGAGAGTWEVSGPGPAPALNRSETANPSLAIAMGSLIRLAMWVVAGLLGMVIGMVFWVKSLFARRMHALSFGARSRGRASLGRLRDCANGNLAD